MSKVLSEKKRNMILGLTLLGIFLSDLMFYKYNVPLKTIIAGSLILLIFFVIPFYFAMKYLDLGVTENCSIAKSKKSKRSIITLIILVFICCFSIAIICKNYDSNIGLKKIIINSIFDLVKGLVLCMVMYFCFYAITLTSWNSMIKIRKLSSRAFVFGAGLSLICSYINEHFSKMMITSVIGGLSAIVGIPSLFVMLYSILFIKSNPTNNKDVS